MNVGPCARCRKRRHVSRESGLCYECRTKACERCGLDRITDCRCDEPFVNKRGAEFYPDGDIVTPEDRRGS